MRLDHLLSKEHTFRSPPSGTVRVPGWVAHGWNITTSARPLSVVGVSASSMYGYEDGLGRTRYWVLESQTPTVVGCGFNQQDRPASRAATAVVWFVGGVW